MKRNFVAVKALAVLSLSLPLSVVSLASPVHADGGDDAQADVAAQAVESLTPPGEPAVQAEIEGDAIVAATNEGLVSIPLDPAQGIAFTSPAGIDVKIGLPGGTRADDASVTDQSTAVYTDALPGVSLAAQPTDGGARAMVVIENPDAPSSYRFPITAPPGSTLEIQDDGSINLIDGTGTPVGSIAAPWATDANGASLATGYRIEGMTVVQDVQFDDASAFPIVADPKFDWGWATGTLYLSKAETLATAAMGYSVGVSAAVCGMLGNGISGPVGGAALAAVCAIYTVPIVFTAGVAANSKPMKCLKIKVIPPAPVPVGGTPLILIPSTYRGGYCK